MARGRALNRREFIGALGAGASLAAGCSTSLTDDLTNSLIDPAVSGPLSPITSTGGNPSTSDLRPASPEMKALLLSRTTFGPTQHEYQKMEELGYEGYLDYQLKPGAIDDSAVTTAISGITTLGMSYPQLHFLPDADLRTDLINATILRAVYSKRQLFERMVHFWTDHFNIHHGSPSSQARYKMIDDRTVIRAHAMGKFRDLLRASSKSPAMQIFLDNVTNRAGRPNENYARELFELHTLGQDNGYTQEDVSEFARALTGWRVNFTTGEFFFDGGFHDSGSKSVLGRSIPAGGGIEEVEQIVDYLATHPNTANLIAGKLVRHFISESAPQSLITTIAQAFLSSDGDIKATLRALFSREIMRSAQPRFKRPFHFMVSSLRQSGAVVVPSANLQRPLKDMGHLTFHWPTPDGYPVENAYWVPDLLSRWKYSTGLSRGEMSGVTLDPVALAGAGATTAHAMSVWNQLFFNSQMPVADINAISQFSDSTTGGDDVTKESFALALSSPAYQWC